MSSEDFKSLIVTDPDLVDEGIDVSGLRTTTDTSPYLLGGIPDYEGIQYSTLAPTKYTDLMRLYSSGLPTKSVSQPAPDFTGGEMIDTGGGGQAITPIATTPINTGGGITNVNTPLTQMITNPITGQTQTVKQAMTSNQAYTTPTPSSPFLASGAAGGANLSQAPYGTNLTTGQPYQTPRTIADQNAVLGQTFNDQQNPSFWENAKNNFIQTGEDIGGFFANLGNQGLDISKLAGTTLLNLAGKAITGVPLLGTAASLVGAALPPRDPRQTALDELYDVKDGTIQSGLMQGYNPVSGSDFLNTVTGGLLPGQTFGLQDAYQDRIDTVENTLKTKYNMTDAEIADVRAGSYTGDVDTDLLDRLNQLEEGKAAEKNRLDLFSGDVDERDQMLEDISLQNQAQTEGDAIRLAQLTGDVDFDTTPTTSITDGTNITTDITSDQIDEFGTAPVTGVTRPGTVLGKPGIERFDDAEAALSNTGTSIDALNSNNRQLHFDNTDKLRAAAQRGEITDDEYKRLSAFDATKTMGVDPVTGTLSSIAYQTVQAAAGDQTVGNAISDIANNISGVAGNITPEEQVKYQEIISGEDIYRDPILGMVESPASMTLADDTINRMTDDVDLDLFDTTPVDTTPIATFDADTFDDDVSFVDPTPAPTPTPSVPDFISGGRDRDPDPAPSAPAKTSQNVTTSQFQAFRDTGGGADRNPAPSRPSAPVSTAGQAGPPSQRGGGGGGGGGGGCFLKGTQVTMADGSTKAIEQVDLGDNVAKGGKVFATGKFLVENLHDYKGIKVSGSHMVSEDDNWVRVEDSKHGKPLGNNEHTVYVFGSENRRILINGITFTDYFETTEQQKLIDNEKDFFNNWKTYENKIDQDNINILNAS